MFSIFILSSFAAKECTRKRESATLICKDNVQARDYKFSCLFIPAASLIPAVLGVKRRMIGLGMHFEVLTAYH